MDLSGRQAALLLTLPPTSLTRRSARRVLACGLAGTPRIGGSTWLYDDDAISALQARQTITAQECAQLFPHGIFVSRRQVDVRWPAAQRREILGRGWPIGLVTQLLIVACLATDGFLPLVATVGGFVVDGFDVTGVAMSGGGDGNDGTTHDLTLADPGEWFDQLRETRLPTGRGREWTMPGWEAPRKQRLSDA